MHVVYLISIISVPPACDLMKGVTIGHDLVESGSTHSIFLSSPPKASYYTGGDKCSCIVACKRNLYKAGFHFISRRTSFSTPTMYRTLSICLLAASLFLSVSSIPSPDEQTLLAPSDPHVSSSWEWSDCGVYLPYRATRSCQAHSLIALFYRHGHRCYRNQVVADFSRSSKARR